MTSGNSVTRQKRRTGKTPVATGRGDSRICLIVENIMSCRQMTWYKVFVCTQLLMNCMLISCDDVTITSSPVSRINFTEYSVSGSIER